MSPGKVVTRLLADDLPFPGRVHDHKLAARDSRAYSPYPQPQSSSPVPFHNRSLVLNNSSSEKHVKGVVKRGGATVKWLSPEQNMAKLEGMKRHEEQLHKEENQRILQHVQTENVPAYHSSNARNPQNTTSNPKVIKVHRSNFQVTSGGSKLLRVSGMSTPFRIRPSFAQYSQTSLLWL